MTMALVMDFDHRQTFMVFDHFIPVEGWRITNVWRAGEWSRGSGLLLLLYVWRVIHGWPHLCMGGKIWLATFMYV